MPWESSLPKLTVESRSQGDHSESRWTAWVLRELSVESRLLTQRVGRNVGSWCKPNPFECSSSLCESLPDAVQHPRVEKKPQGKSTPALESGVVRMAEGTLQT